MSVSATKQDESCNNTNGVANCTSTGGNPPYNFSWSNGTSANNASGFGITGLDSGMYIVTVTDANGCVKKDTVVVGAFFTPACVFIPNAFSPNGDGDHDVFFIENIEYFSSVKLEVYNRWGNIVYDNPEYANDWDGMNGGEKLPGGVYLYVITLNDTEVQTGTLTLIR